MKGRGSRR